MTLVRRSLDRARIADLTLRERRRLDDRTQASADLFRRARRSLSGGVASGYQSREPWPIYVERGAGQRIWDVDGNTYLDFHNGFGSMIQGHAHPAVVAAIEARLRRGSHFAAPTEEMVWVAEELARRWGLPEWRFTNSGTEATMDAIRIGRALTGRDTVLKIAGSYHGHHDYVMVSVGVGPTSLDPADPLRGIAYGAGIPEAVVRMTVPVAFNDADALERTIEALARDGRKPACLIMEAALMNLGVVLPRDGYLDAVRDITRRHGIVWIVDEVKTGLTVAAGGATERFGLSPDLVTLAKSLGAGLPSGAVGGTAEAMAPVREGRVYQVGTFNGSPLAMAAARASLESVLTSDAYRRLDVLNLRILEGCREVLDRHGLPGYAVGVGAKGVVTFSPVPIVDHVTYLRNQDREVTELAWLYAMNRGIFMTPGREEEWTLTVAHTEADVDRYVEVFDDLASEMVGD